MAAIIAQITRASRERKKQLKEEFVIVIGKCMYDIKPFPDRYDPKVILG